jgi:3-oxoacyl-[acyl-carrier-protein] synthase-3
MATTDTPSGILLAGTGSCVPPRTVTNADIAATLDTSDEWIRVRTGISERRFAGTVDTAATLGTAAARNALAAAGLTSTDVDLIVCGTVTPDLMCPSTACLIQAYLGCRTVPAFDVSAACSGFLYALGTAQAFLKTGSFNTALVVGTEVLSRTLDFSDRNTCILFGDGAGAAVLTANGESKRGLHSVRLYADGARQELIQVPSTVTPNPPPGPVALPQLRFVRMNGREVFKFAVVKMNELIVQARADCKEKGLDDIALLVPHQVNQRIIDSAVEATGFPKDRVMTNLCRYGNTSAASVPIALDEAIREGKCKVGDTVLLAAFGGGLTWSSALVTL